jgi:hypothetical protein
VTAPPIPIAPTVRWPFCEWARRSSCGDVLQAWCSGGLPAVFVWGFVATGAVAVWAGHVEDDLSGLGILLFGYCRQGAEELVGDIGEDGGAAGGDFVLGEEQE